MQYPFFLKLKNAVVVDSLCQCGHQHTQHNRISSSLGKDTVLPEYCGGKCCGEGCLCSQFHWAKWILQEDTRPVKRDEKEGGVGA